MRKITTAIITFLLVISSASATFAAETVTVIKDGTRNDAIWATVENGVVSLEDTYTDVKILFPEETQGMWFPGEFGVKSPIQKWTTQFGYDFRLDGNTVYVDKGQQSQPTKLIVEVYYNGQRVEFPDKPPFLKLDESRTYVPVRFMAEAFGYEVTWNPESQSVIITNGYYEVGMIPGYSYFYKNGKRYDMDATTFLEEGRTYVPLRFASEAFGKNVEWDGANRRVLITNPSKEVR